MKRRIFLSAASTIGIVGAVSSASVVSSAYSSINTSVMLEEFNATTRTVFDRFLAQSKQNCQSLGLDEKVAKQLALPVHIVSNTTSGNHHQITYKSKGNQYVSISVKEGVDSITITDTLA